MVWLTCRCLNLKIHVKNSELTPVAPATIGVNSAQYSGDDFFTGEICLVQLDLEGVTKQYDCLTRERSIGDWTLSKCLNCQMKTHAIHIHQGDNHVLVNAKLKSETTLLETVKSSPEYSPLYKILIPGRNDYQPVQSYGPRVGRLEAMQQESLVKIQQQLNTYLIDEETAMEERIRQYEQQQRSAFTELQSRARWDKTKLISVAVSVEDEEVSETLSDAMTESPMSPLSPASQDNSSSSASFNSDKKSFSLTPGKPEQKPMTLNLTRRPAPQVAPMHKSPEADGMFDMEGFDDVLLERDGEPFDESEDEDNDTDDSSYSSDASMRESLRNNRGHSNLYSQSVPMNVPMWTMQSQHRYRQSDSPDDRGGSDDIGASIKALAMSVRVDGTEIFGDLPRGSNKQFKTVEIMKRREKCRYKDES